jgi:hypothetical protein
MTDHDTTPEDRQMVRTLFGKPATEEADPGTIVSPLPFTTQLFNTEK